VQSAIESDYNGPTACRFKECIINTSKWISIDNGRCNRPASYSRSQISLSQGFIMSVDAVMGIWLSIEVLSG
jgi:hypothetical protein